MGILSSGLSLLMGVAVDVGVGMLVLDALWNLSQSIPII